jgi:subtilisin family serine protease
VNQRTLVVLTFSLGLLGLLAVGAGLGDVQTTDVDTLDRQVGDGQIDAELVVNSVQTEQRADVEIDEKLREADGDVEVVVSLSESELQAGTGSDGQLGVQSLRAHANATQEHVVEFARNRAGVTVESRFWLTNAVLLSVDTGQVSMAELAAVDRVERLGRNVEMEPEESVPTASANNITEATNDDASYGLEQIRAPEVWDTYGTRGEGTTVAVLDTGVDASHPDLNVSAWAEFDSGGDRVGSSPYDSGSHGTHTSGTVAGGNDVGIHIGVAPGTELHHGGVLTDEGGTFGAVIGGMQWAVANDADVISMSLGTTGYIDSMIDAVRNAENAGTTVVASAGNSGDGSSNTPGNTYDGIGVGASNSVETIPGFSSGERIDTTSAWNNPPADWPAEYVVPTVAAPGRLVPSTAPNKSYAYRSGTSMAAPHVAGAVALIESAVDYDPSPADIKQALEATATKPDGVSTPPGERDTRYGSGIIDVPAAIDYLSTSGNASFQVDSVTTNGPVTEGSTLEVTATVENTGDAAGSQSVALDAGGLGSDATTVSLNGGESTTVTFTLATSGGDAGSYTASVASADDAASAAVTVLAPTRFEVTGLGATDPVEGEDIAVEFTVENTGDVDGTETVNLSTDPSLDQNSTELTLVGGESAIKTLSVNTASGDAGNYTATIASEDDTNSTGVTVQEPAQFAVSITGTDSPVVAGESLTVDATVENTGDVSDTQTIALDAGSLGTDSAAVSLNGGESTSVALSVATESGDSGSYTAGVSSADDTASTGVSVETPAYLAVTVTGSDSPVVAGETVTVNASVENTGDVAGTQTVTLDAGALGSDTNSVSLNGSESTSVALSVATGAGDAGAYATTVSSADEAAGTNVTVQAPAAFAVTISGSSAPIVEGESLTVDVTVENTGDVSDTQTVTLDAGDLGTDSAAVSLAGGESTVETFAVSTNSGDAGGYTATVASADDTDTAGVTVQEPAYFAVNVTGSNSPLGEGELLSVDATVENTGDVADKQTVTLDAGALGSDAVSVSLSGSESTALTFSLQTSSGDAGSYTAFVSSANDTDSTAVTVQEPANFAVTITGTDSPVLAGESLTVDATVENTGDVSGTQTLTLDAGGLGSNATSVTLGGNESAGVSLSVDTVGGDAGSYEATLAGENDAENVSVTVQAPAAFAVTISGSSAPVVAGESLAVDATIENTGDVAGNQSVTLDAGGLGTDSISVSLAGGESTAETFTVSTGSGDAGGYTASVASANDADSTGVTVQEPTSFAVSIVGTNSPVVTGDSLSVEATVENTGDVGDTQTLTLDVGSLGSDSVSVSLGGGSTTTETLSIPTTDGDAGTYTASVASADDADSTGVTVQKPGVLTVNITSADTPLVAGETLSVDATVENTGDVADTQTLTLDAGSLGSDATTVSLAGGEATTLTLSVDTGSGDAGAYTATVSNSDDTDSTAVTVQEPAYIAVSITSTESPVVAGETLTVDAAIENTGDVADTQTITLDAGGLGTDATSVSLAGGESTSVALSVATVGDDAGNYNSTVTSADDSESAGVTVQEPARFTVSITGTDSPVVAGETLTVDVAVENTGDVSDTQTVTLDAGSLGGTSTTTTLAGGETVTETLSLATGAGDAGDYTVTVGTADETASAVATVLEPAAFTVGIVETTSPVEGDRLTVTAAVNNTGDVGGTETVTLDVGGLGQNSTAVSLGGGATVERTLSVGTTGGDAGTYTATVSGETDDDVTDVTVGSPGGGVALVDIVTSASIIEGESLAVDVTVANTDGTATTEQIRVDGGGLGNTSATVTVDAGETDTTTVVLETETGADSLGTHTLTVAVGDDSMERSVEARLPALRGADSPPQDLDSDSTFEDIDGDGTFDISDVYILYNNVRSASVQEHSWAFDFNGDGNVDTYDVWVLVDRLY